MASQSLGPAALKNLVDELQGALNTIAAKSENSADAQAASEGVEQINALKVKLASVVESQFVAAVDQMSQRAFANAQAKGFWPEGYTPTAAPNAGRNDGEVISLMHSECSELLEAYRNEDVPQSRKIPGYTLAEEELADLVLRALDYAASRKIRLGEAILAKHAYNLSRPYKHGRRF